MSANSQQSFSEYLAQFPQSLNSTGGQFSALSGGFSGAGVFRYESMAGTQVLRLWPNRNGLPVERILGLHQLLEHLQITGVETAVVPQKNSLGATLSKCGNRHFQIEQFVEGKADFRENPSNERLQNAMHALANWHQAAAMFQPSRENSLWFGSTVGVSPAITERLQLLRRLLSGGKDKVKIALNLHSNSSTEEQNELLTSATIILDAFERIAPQLMLDMERASSWKVRLQPCLRDIWHDHVLFSGDDVAAIIDPSATRTESVAADLARLLGSFLGNDTSRWQDAIGFYQEVRPLDNTERQLIPVMDRSGLLLSGIRWLEKLFVEKPSQQPSMNVITRVKEIAGRFDDL